MISHFIAYIEHLSAAVDSIDCPAAAYFDFFEAYEFVPHFKLSRGFPKIRMHKDFC